MSFYGHIQNAFTGQIHTDKRIGSRAELEFYRVIPEGHTTKLFFDSVAEYGQWRVKHYLDEDPSVDDAQRDRLAEEPFDFAPAAFRTDFLSRRSHQRCHVDGVGAADVQPAGERHAD